MINMHSLTRKSARQVLAVLAACLLLALASQVQAQGRTYTGQVQELNEMALEGSAGYLLIEDSRVPFDRTRITVYYQNQVIDSYHLLPGLRIRYTLHGDGYIRDVHLLGPRDFIEEMLVD